MDRLFTDILRDSLVKYNVCNKHFLFSHHQTHLQSRKFTVIRNLSQGIVKQLFFFFFLSAEASPAECCQHAKGLEGTQFVDGYKTLGFQETIYGEFLARLRENPRLVASCLVAGERLNQEHTQAVIHTVFTSLYGNCIMQEDERFLLQVRRIPVFGILINIMFKCSGLILASFIPSRSCDI